MILEKYIVVRVLERERYNIKTFPDNIPIYRSRYIYTDTHTHTHTHTLPFLLIHLDTAQPSKHVLISTLVKHFPIHFVRVSYLHNLLLTKFFLFL